LLDFIIWGERKRKKRGISEGIFLWLRNGALCVGSALHVFC